jgi:ATPase subunit of ABC transporter with duplicated ATPase domains
MAEKFIFHMYGVNKFYGQKQVLKDINLGFFPGAKIGIVGENGSGKTTVLRIMAGLDTEFRGSFHFRLSGRYSGTGPNSIRC